LTRHSRHHPAPVPATPVPPDDRLQVTYRLRTDARQVHARAEALALEQSVELPLDAVRDPRVREEIVARVQSVRAVDEATHEVVLALAASTTGFEAGQLLNMLFGNASLQEDVALVDVELPRHCATRFGGPRHGIEGWRRLTHAHGRPLTCSALKPQGLPAATLAELAGTFARAGLDVVKDDHGLADQAYAPFAERVHACQAAVDEANAVRGGHTVYAPSLSGSLDDMRAQIALARSRGVRAFMVAPMLCGVATLATLAREADAPLLAHPALAGAARIAPPLLLGKLFRLFGADATIFPNAGGRFSYAQATCDAIIEAARAPWHAVRATLPVPAGGMTVERVPEITARYGPDVMLLLGGSLLQGGDALPERCRAFARAASGAKD